MTYTSCEIVNTWGIIEFCHYKPTNVYASYRRMSSYPQFNALVNAVKTGVIKLPRIFCHPEATKELVHKYLKHIDFPFVLVTSHYDSDMPIGALTPYETSLLLNNPYLVRWYSQNCVIKHPKITGIAIGLDYHTLANTNPANGHSWGQRETPLEQEATLLRLRKGMTHISERIVKCYSTCHMFIGRGHGQDRIDAINQIPSCLLSLEKERVPRETSWKNQQKFAFVLSPHGNGLDCHRTWEALALGCIPVVKTSPIDGLFTGLPVLIVNSWKDITQKLLTETVSQFINAFTEELPEKLKLKYWTDRIADGEDIA